ncbi:hypothetical protein [Stenotrophomonas geniculata]|uniref:ATP-binding protein n=1 Tax=Stenotrophomonas geniculata TaxID=86188 RepID=UPI002E79E572|nr:hypothetical protein [Stenotrophomonas geniculata]
MPIPAEAGVPNATSPGSLLGPKGSVQGGAMAVTWDPLQNGNDIDGEIIAAAQKRQIKNILKSYVGMYDSFSELLQNALDALDRRCSEDGDGYKPKLWIRIDLAENSFSVVDNGVGFKEKEFKSFLAPNISFKDGRKARGNKGVGATYIAYGFDSLTFATKGNGYLFCGEMLGGRTWVDDENGIVVRPVVEEALSSSQTFDAIDRGSYFRIVFGGVNSRPKSLSWYQATTAEQWLYLLLIRTPLGSVPFIGEAESKVTFDLEVISQDGAVTSISNAPPSYMFPHLKIKASINLKDVLDYQEKALKDGKDPGALPSKYSKLNGIYEFFDTGKLLEMRSLGVDEDISRVISEFSVEAYGYFSYSTSIWDQLNDSVAKLRRGYRILRGGLQLANNRMIQGDLIVIPLTSNTGYQNQAHILVHFKGADPDLGRKGFQPELRTAAEAISVAIVNRHKQWRSKLLKTDSGAKPEISKELELHEWVKQQEKYESDNPLVIENKNFFAPVREISITSIPQSEQDVIVLFNQLIAGGVIRGIRLLATNQVRQYDGIFKFSIKEPLANHVFDKMTNPLGVEELHHDGERVSAPKILEYKHSLDGLIREFENGEKSEKDVHLAVVWDIGEEWKRTYEALSLLDLDNIHQRDFHGLTHVLSSGNTRLYLIVLKELVAYLNNVDGVQDFQKVMYGGGGQ